MGKLIQICASQNDLFGLDGDGVVFQYNFNSNTWLRLGRDWGGRCSLPLDEPGSISEAEALRRDLDAEPPITRRRD